MDLGILQIGAIDVPVYPTISVEDYIYIFNNAEIKYVLFQIKICTKITSSKTSGRKFERNFYL